MLERAREREGAHSAEPKRPPRFHFPLIAHFVVQYCMLTTIFFFFTLTTDFFLVSEIPPISSPSKFLLVASHFPAKHQINHNENGSF